MNDEHPTLDQADGLCCVMGRQVYIDKLKEIQTELRQAIIAGNYTEAKAIMVLLSKAQAELEETY